MNLEVLSNPEESRRDLAHHRIENAIDGNTLCNGLRLLRLCQIRTAYDKLNFDDKQKIRGFFLLACSQPLD